MKNVKISKEAEKRKRLRLSASFGTIRPSSKNERNHSMENQTLMQYFEWYLPDDGQHWNRLAEDAPN